LEGGEMSSDTEELFGYILLFIGLICILSASYSMYNVFTSLAQPPGIFKMDSFSIPIPASVYNPSTVVKIPLDPEIIKIVNIFLHYLFKLFIVIVGSKISGLGIQLIKEIKVEMKSKS
jgi:hypothetical protein